MKATQRYLYLFWSLFRLSAMADLEYRINFITRIITDIFWYIAQIVVFEVIFTQTNHLAGWSLPEMRVFLGLLFIVDALWMMLFSENLENFSQKIRTGELDLILAKPVNSQFLVSIQRMNSAYLANLAMGIGWLIWSVHHLPQDPVISDVFAPALSSYSAWRWVWLIITIPCSILIVYSVRFLFASVAVIFVQADYLTYLWFQFYKLGTRPDSLFPRWLRYLILSAIPVAFIASVPAGIVLGRLPTQWALIGIALTIFILSVSHWFWNFALSRYSSASS